MELEFWALVQNVLETIVLGTLVVAIPALGLQARQWLKSKLSVDRLEIVERLASTIVMSIEQEYANIGGGAKLARAVKLLEVQLLENGIKLELLELTQAIEAAVFAELNQWRIEEPEPVDTLPTLE